MELSRDSGSLLIEFAVVRREVRMVDESRPVERVGPAPIFSTVTVFAPTVWLTASFAAQWFADAVREARQPRGQPAERRREIVFAVCTVEAYLIEWTRDDVLRGDFAGLSRYFPPDTRSGIRDRWKNVIKNLAADGRIAVAPAWDGPVWKQFMDLVTYRDGLVHARTGRPETSGIDQDELPLPTLAQLDAISPGWATNVVAGLIAYLHANIGTDTPPWIQAALTSA